MNEDTRVKLASVVEVLGNIDVKGKTNLLNLGGCIAVLEDLLQSSASAEPQDKE